MVTQADGGKWTLETVGRHGRLYPWFCCFSSNELNTFGNALRKLGKKFYLVQVRYTTSLGQIHTFCLNSFCKYDRPC